MGYKTLIDFWSMEASYSESWKDPSYAGPQEETVQQLQSSDDTVCDPVMSSPGRSVRIAQMPQMHSLYSKEPYSAI